MGHDVHAIGNHTLKTTSIELLAADLSERLGCQVNYGYINDWITEDGHFPDFAFVEQGRIGEAFDETYILIDDDYWDKIHKPEEFRDSLCFKFYCEANYDSYLIYIHKDAFLVESRFISRWWEFCRAFTGKNDSMKYVQWFREDCRWEIERFGGNTALYLDDQGEFGGMEFDTMSFHDGLTILRSNRNVLDISAWVRSGSAILKEYPLGFIDDFSDFPVVSGVST